VLNLLQRVLQPLHLPDAGQACHGPRVSGRGIVQKQQTFSKQCYTACTGCHSTQPSSACTLSSYPHLRYMVSAARASAGSCQVLVMETQWNDMK